MARAKEEKQPPVRATRPGKGKQTPGSVQPRTVPVPRQANPAPISTGREAFRTPITNADVARAFHEVADLLEVQGSNPFRARAYRNAARTIEGLADSILGLLDGGARNLRAMQGIGPALADRIEELGRTGTLAMLRELQTEVPGGAAELMRVPGIGRRTATVLARELNVRSLDEVEEAARAGRIRELRGFGETTERRILQAIERYRAEPRRMPRTEAARHADAIVAALRGMPGVTRADVAGSFRRCLETVGNLDFVAATERPAAVVERFTQQARVHQVLSSGVAEAAVVLHGGLRADLHVVSKRGYGAALLHYTGSKSHASELRAQARRRGLTLEEGGLRRGRSRVAGAEEEEVYQALGLPWIPPELREGRGEIEAARARRLPRLIEQAQIRGDLQTHSTDSDGSDSLAEMAEAARALGYEYMAITDHSPAVKVAGGMDGRGFRAQWKRIDRLNERLEDFTILKGAEVDILADGSLDLDDETLAGFDVVLVSIHSAFDLPEPEQTRRVLKALRHPSVHIFAHPAGRKINRRQGARFDIEAVCRAAADLGVHMEVNGQPERLDMDDVTCRAAVEHGVGIVISTDSHSTAELRNMRWAVEQARRGWTPRTQVANAKPLAGLRKLLRARSASGSRRRRPKSP